MVEHWKNTSLNNITENINGGIYYEEWKSVGGYEGIYEVSNFGRIKSLKRHLKKSNQ